MIELDLLRALAIAFVLGRHWLLPFDRLPAPVSACLDVWRRGGWVGVDLFFVLSGFLVSGLLFREHQKTGSIQVTRFLIRRGLKIYPAFYAFLLVTLPICAVFRPASTTARNVAGELLFLQNYLGRVWNHTWSLAVEEHFYLGIPVVLIALAAARQLRWLAVALLTLLVSVSCLAFRLATPSVTDPANLAVIPTHLRIDSLMFGVLIAATFHLHQARYVTAVRRWRWALLVIGVCSLALPFALEESSPWLKTWGLSVLYVGSGCLVALATVHRVPRNLPLRAAAYVGSHSYSIYLWHMPLAWASSIVGTRILGNAMPGGPGFFVYIVVAIGVGIVAANLIEIPALRVRNRLWPSRIDPTVSPP